MPARAPGWGRGVRWARLAAQVAVVAAVVWQVVGHAVRGTASAEAWCPFGGFETVWTLLTTGQTVPHRTLVSEDGGEARRRCPGSVRRLSAR